MVLRKTLACRHTRFMTNPASTTVLKQRAVGSEAGKQMGVDEDIAKSWQATYRSAGNIQVCMQRIVMHAGSRGLSL